VKNWQRKGQLMKEFQGYTVLVTGGASGIGRETTEQFVRQGAEVIIADIDEKAIGEVIKSIGRGVVGKKCDVTITAEILELRDLIDEKQGKLDILVNNAGSVKWGNIEDMPEENWDFNIDLLLKGPYLVTKQLIPLLKKSSHPSVVNISSLAAINNWPNNPAYSVAKLGLIKLTRCITRDFFWLRCNAIQPGIIDTPIYDLFLDQQEKAELFEKYKEMTPAGRIGMPADIATAILFLSSEKASFINGATLLIDGGLTQNWLPGW